MESSKNMMAAGKTYDAFTGMVKWAAIAVALLVVLVIVLIT